MRLGFRQLQYQVILVWGGINWSELTACTALLGCRMAETLDMTSEGLRGVMFEGEILETCTSEFV